MKILFLTLSNINSIYDKGIYTDLLRKFNKEGHEVSVMSPSERRYGQKETIIQQENVKIVKVKIGNITKTNIVEKGITTLTIDRKYRKMYTKVFNRNEFDLVLYSTPPITFIKTINHIKKMTNATTYLMLKDIFPQNAIDINMMKKDSLIHRYFLKKEKKLYDISDLIGCMSPANCNYVMENNVKNNLQEKIHILPNTIEIEKNVNISKENIRKKYNVPIDKTIFIYGGNIGRPQGIGFLLKNLKKIAEDCDDAHFLIIGSGTEFLKVKKFHEDNKLDNLTVMNSIPSADFLELTKSSDIGLILLDHRFTIPNFPSRLLTYMEAKLPILAATDVNTDIGQIVSQNGFGKSCNSDDSAEFIMKIQELCSIDRIKMGEKGYNYLEENYTVNNSYEIIMNQFNKLRGTENV